MDWMTILYALLGGIVPALLWLWFFLGEDRLHPEPRKYIAITFLLGIPAIVIAVGLEYLTQCNTKVPFSDILLYACDSIVGAPVFTWAFIEELAKLFVVSVVVLWRKRLVDEPIDAMVYLITIALGFAAFETTLFILEPLARGAFGETIALANLRFIGAALVHTLSSGLLGFFIAMSFYSTFWKRVIALCTGLFFAGVLHGVFNHHILKSAGEDATLLFFSVWIGIIALFLLFERAKRITKNPRKN